MSSFTFLLTLLAGGSFLAWLGVGGYAVGGRGLHDLRQRRLARAGERASGRGLSGRTVRHAAGDPSLSPQVSLAFAFEAAAAIGTRGLAARAGSHRTERGKWRRIEALRILARTDEATALPLLELALAGDEDVAAAGAALLGSLGSEAAARALARGIGSSSVPDSRLAAQLDSFPRAVVQVVRDLAADASPGRRYWGVSLLSRYAGREDARHALRIAAADPDPNVRAAVAEALGAAHGHGLDELRALVRDETWFVRAHAARSLGAHRRPELGPSVAPLLADESWWVRAAAKDALAALGAVAAATVTPYLHSSDGFARNGAVEVLERIGNVDVVLAEAARAPYNYAKRRAAHAIIAASEAAYRAAVERAEPALRPSLLALVEPVAEAA